MRPAFMLLLVFNALLLAACNPFAPRCYPHFTGGDTSELNKALQQALDHAGIIGTVNTRASREVSADCSYSQIGLAVDIIVDVPDTHDLAAMATLAARIEKTLGNLVSFADPNTTLTFQESTESAGKECLWDFEAQKCRPPQ